MGEAQVYIDVIEVADDGQHHTYWSTYCRHALALDRPELHDQCSATELAPGVPRRPAQCKTCAAPCACPCGHAGTPKVPAAPPEPIDLDVVGNHARGLLAEALNLAGIGVVHAERVLAAFDADVWPAVLDLLDPPGST